MSKATKSESKGDLVKPTKQSATATGSSSKPSVSKATQPDISLNTSMEELTALGHQIEGLSEDLKSVRDDLKMVMKKDQMEEFIKETVSKIISDLNENIDMMVEIKTEEKTKEIKEQLNELEEENRCLKQDILSMKKELTTLRETRAEADKTSKAAMAKANDNEQYSRKNNVKVMGFEEKAGETEDDLKKGFLGLLRGKGVAVDPSGIAAIHRIPGKKGLPRPVLVKLVYNSDKAKVMRKRREFRDGGNRFVDDVTKLNTELITRLTSHRNIEQAWYFNGHVYGKSTAGKRYRFDIFDDISAIMR